MRGTPWDERVLAQADLFQGYLANATAEASLFFRRTDVATDADFEYFSIFGGNTAAQIQGILNQVDGIYQTDHRITLRLVFQSIWTVANDPYGATAGPSATARRAPRPPSARPMAASASTT